MFNKKYKTGCDRSQLDLLPPRVDEYVSEGNPVRAIDAYVDSLDLQSLGLTGFQSANRSGQPAYSPCLYFKLYIYGYLNRVHSSRRLEREAARNLEVIWLTAGLIPSYKSIANFRKDNSQALKNVNKDFVWLCKELELFAGETVAVDGSFFKGDASKASIFTEKKLVDDLAELEKKIDAYEAALNQQDAQDNEDGVGSLVEDPQLAEKIKKLKAKQAEKKDLQRQLEASGDTQISTVDKDARYLSKNGQSVAGYNVQIVVDSQHRLILAQDVTQDSSDIKQLAPMLEKAQHVLASGQLNALADAGYYSRGQLKLADEKGINIYVPVPRNDGMANNQGVFARDKFIYDAINDCYQCPNDHRLSRVGNLTKQAGHWLWVYRSKCSVCRSCPLRTQCLGEKKKLKTLKRWEHEALVEKHKKHMEGTSAMMRKRSGMVEHPFGVLKFRAGMHHFLMRGLEKCRGEFSLMTLCYNLTRVLNILGVDKLRDYCVQRAGKRGNQLKMA